MGGLRRYGIKIDSRKDAKAQRRVRLRAVGGLKEAKIGGVPGFALLFEMMVEA
jgi:hypothetical protein